MRGPCSPGQYATDSGERNVIYLFKIPAFMFSVQSFFKIVYKQRPQLYARRMTRLGVGVNYRIGIYAERSRHLYLFHFCL